MDVLQRLEQQAYDPETGWHPSLEECAAALEILSASRQKQAQLLLSCLTRLLWVASEGHPEPARLCRVLLLVELAGRLLQRRLPLEPAQQEALAWYLTHPFVARRLGARILHQLEWQGEPTTGVRDHLRHFRRTVQAMRHSNDLAQRTEHLLRRPELNRPWRELLSHAERAPAHPSRRWFRKAVGLVASVGTRALHEHLKQRPSPGLAWMCQEPALLVAVAQRSRRGALLNACVGALLRLEALEYLILLDHRMPLCNPVRSALREIARRRGWPREELEERATSSDWLLPAHRSRLASMLREERVLEPGYWAGTYLDHPVLSKLGKTLVWRFGDRSGMWKEGRLVDCRGEPLKVTGPVRLWHPLYGDQWPEVKQPFRQIGREVYSDASFVAGQRVRQHQFGALCRRRGWRYSLAGRFHPHQTAWLKVGDVTIELPLEGSGNTTPEGLYLEVTSGALRLSGEPSPVLLSEVLRDMHLFFRRAGSPTRRTPCGHGARSSSPHCGSG